MIKSTALDPSVIDADGVYRKEAQVKVFTSEPAAIGSIAMQDILRLGDYRYDGDRVRADSTGRDAVIADSERLAHSGSMTGST